MWRWMALLFLLFVLSSTWMVRTGVFDERGVLHTKGVPWSEEARERARQAFEAERAQREREEEWCRPPDSIVPCVDDETEECCAAVEMYGDSSDDE